MRVGLCVSGRAFGQRKCSSSESEGMHNTLSPNCSATLDTPDSACYSRYLRRGRLYSPPLLLVWLQAQRTSCGSFSSLSDITFSVVKGWCLQDLLINSPRHQHRLLNIFNLTLPCLVTESLHKTLITWTNNSYSASTSPGYCHIPGRWGKTLSTLMPTMTTDRSIITKLLASASSH